MKSQKSAVVTEAGEPNGASVTEQGGRFIGSGGCSWERMNGERRAGAYAEVRKSNALLISIKKGFGRRAPPRTGRESES